jgi:uncharacterized protein YecE (DUF72 family)
MAVLKIGTCSWKYDSWRGLIYSDDKEINYLKEYSHVFETVEIDQWFWSLHGINKITLPKTETALTYKNSVNKNFQFTIKLPNSLTLTHLYQQSKDEPLVPNPHFLSGDLLAEFLNSIKPLKKNLGPLMFQFEYLNKMKMKSQYEFQGLFREFSNTFPAEFQFAVETRNPNYLNSKYFQFLRDQNLGHVFLQGYFMPDICEVYSAQKDFIKNFCVIRLHGADRKGIEQRTGGMWNQIVEPRDSELSRIAEMIIELLERKVDVYLNVNNHYEGSAPLTINKIKDLLTKSGSAPESLNG